MACSNAASYKPLQVAETAILSKSTLMKVTMKLSSLWSLQEVHSKQNHHSRDHASKQLTVRALMRSLCVVAAEKRNRR